ncbi:NADPH-dependent oxidoreductase [Stutzerimonas kirkiae]|uniref:NADPH-dependent oxidoreductase n=1 Tax=Stutzerimonas kirkiae TaxID=2211392 RepID=UPI00103851AB|nr:NADPH-dependent oxidoreductase [Stutzerimonas kirkiae]TBV10286.1 NADPH-dependent oxidoreductase [Stutzerimonas kirkiae]TBV16924.1 NADPH-dependent oxidoreductase [Stutzerimonas kirkiae]
MPAAHPQPLWQQRYGSADAPSAEPGNALIEQLLAHRSVRAYLDQPLPDGTLETLLAAAQSAATSSNLQAWSLLAVEDRQRKARLAALANDQAHIVQAPLFLVWLADFSRAARLAERHGRELQAVEYLDSLLVGGLDAALAAQNAVLAAEALGLGTVYIGALRNNLQAVIDELQLPPLVFPVFGLCVGYPDPSRPAAIKPRLPQSVVLHRETYRLDEQEPHRLDDYDRQVDAFYREQGLENPAWSRQVIDRLASVNSLHGRERLAQVLHRQRLALR